LLVGGIVLFSLIPASADWPGFRGPKADGSAEDKDLPVKWSSKENVVWKTKLPGPGTSSPIVWGQRVFLTCYSGYGTGPGKKGDPKDLRRHLLCLQRDNGKILWQKDIAPKLPETPYNPQLGEHGYASSTPVTDGERIYVFFGRTGVLAFDFAGKQLWQTEVGTSLNSWGSAASPVLYKDLVLVNASVESASLLALNKKSGTPVWRVKGLPDSWSTPVLVSLPGGKQEVVLNGPGSLEGFDPATGTKLWYCDGIDTATASSTPIARDGVVYAMGALMGGAPTMVAVRAGGRGDVSKTHVLWRQKAGTNHCSPVLSNGYLYWVAGQVNCLKVDTGAVAFRERLYEVRLRQEYVSAVASGGKVFVFTRGNGAYVFAAKGKFELLAHNDLGDQSIFNASPAIDNGQLLIRSNEYAYCIGKK
jgi:outer membrane protein assembly factor BamB